MAEIKKVPKKLRDGPVIAVDYQIVLWRSRMAKAAAKGELLGRTARYRARKNAEQRERRREDAIEKRDGKNKRWFE